MSVGITMNGDGRIVAGCAVCGSPTSRVMDGTLERDVYLCDDCERVTRYRVYRQIFTMEYVPCKRTHETLAAAIAQAQSERPGRFVIQTSPSALTVASLEL